MFTFCNFSSDLIYLPILINHQSYIGYDSSLNKITFQVGRVKVKDTVAIFRKKNFVVVLELLFMG